MNYHEGMSMSFELMKRVREKNQIVYDSIMITFLKVESELHSLELKYKTRVKDVVGYTIKYYWQL